VHTTSHSTSSTLARCEIVIFGLGDGAIAGDIDGRAAEEVQDAHAARVTFSLTLMNSSREP